MFKRFAFFLSSLFIFTASVVNADTTAPGANTAQDNFLGPVISGQAIGSPSDNIAVSGAFEAGPRDFRGDATAGIAFGNQDKHRLKFTGEFLTQDIDYDFYSGVVRHWVDQGAAGLAYEYALDETFLRHFDLSGYYSHAPSIDLSPVTGSFVQNGSIIDFTNLRRIAGSNAGGGAAGFTVRPWPNADLTLAGNYDDVVYDNRYQPQISARGLGGTATLSQMLSNHLKLNLSGAIRAAFNDYQADVAWVEPTRAGKFEFGIFGGYTEGKDTLPNTGIAGINISYLGQSDVNSLTLSTAAENLKQQGSINLASQNDTSLNEWVAQPAVYMPQVLAISDQQVTTTSHSACTAPSFTGPAFADVFLDTGGGPQPFPATATAGSFSLSSGLTYSIVHSTLPPGVSIAIDPTTGVVTGTIPQGITDTFTVQITASNACGTAVSNTFTVELNFSA